MILVPDLALEGHALKIQNIRHKTQDARDEGRLTFFSYYKRMRGLPVRVPTYSEQANGILTNILPYFLGFLVALPICYLTDIFSDISCKLLKAVWT